MAHLAAHRAAYTALTAWDPESTPERVDALWKDYDRYCRESAAQFLALALFWYGNERRTESWWGRAREVLRAWLPVDIGDHGAFIAVSAGLTRHYERLLATTDLVDDQHEAVDVPFDDAQRGETIAQAGAERAHLFEARPQLEAESHRQRTASGAAAPTSTSSERSSTLAEWVRHRSRCDRRRTRHRPRRCRG